MNGSARIIAMLFVACAATMVADGHAAPKRDTGPSGSAVLAQARAASGDSHWDTIKGLDADGRIEILVGTDGKDDLTDPNFESRTEKKRELEAKLILGSYFKGWTIAEDFIAEKNVRHAPFEFGYAVGISRRGGGHGGGNEGGGEQQHDELSGAEHLRCSLQRGVGPAQFVRL